MSLANSLRKLIILFSSVSFRISVDQWPGRNDPQFAQILVRYISHLDKNYAFAGRLSVSSKRLTNQVKSIPASAGQSENRITHHRVFPGTKAKILTWKKLVSPIGLKLTLQLNLIVGPLPSMHLLAQETSSFS